MTISQRVAEGLWKAQQTCLSCSRGPRCADCRYTLDVIRLLFGCLRHVTHAPEVWAAEKNQRAGLA